MRRLLTGLLLAAALTGTAAAAQPAPVLAVEWEAGGGKLRWVSPTTLRPVGSRVLNVGGAPANVVAVSPDGELAALGGGTNGRLRIVRLVGLRQTGLVWLGGESVLAASWTTPNRLAVVTGSSPAEAVGVDLRDRRIVRRVSLDGTALAAARAGNRLVTLLAPPVGVGPARLAIVDARGGLRTVPLAPIEAGFAPPGTLDAAGRYASPALATEGTRALVLAVDRFTVIDLTSLKARSHRLPIRATARSAKLSHGWGRSAVWLGGNTIGFTGSHSRSDGPPTYIGVHLLDVATGSARMLDARALELARAGATLLTYGRDELRGYRLDGTHRYTLLEGTDTGYVQVAGRWAYVGSANSTRFTIVDVVRGRVAGHAQTAKPVTVLAP